jgi:hypothetical protein
MITNRLMSLATRLQQKWDETTLDKQFLGKVGEFSVFTIDGEFVRDNIDIDYVAGGNHSRYPKYVPKGEIWLEQTNDPLDMAATSLHEAIEATIMHDEKMGHEKAHDLADTIEKPLRKLLQLAPPKNNQEAVMLVAKIFPLIFQH